MRVLLLPDGLSGSSGVVGCSVCDAGVSSDEQAAIVVSGRNKNGIKNISFIFKWLFKILFKECVQFGQRDFQIFRLVVQIYVRCSGYNKQLFRFGSFCICVFREVS